MQFTPILAALSLALAASASPLVERTGTPPPTTPAQGVQNQCGNTANASCCNDLEKTYLGLTLVELGKGCNNLDLVSALSVASQCSPDQQVACCSSGAQNGAVNVGQVVCAPVKVG